MKNTAKLAFDDVKIFLHKSPQYVCRYCSSFSVFVQAPEDFSTSRSKPAIIARATVVKELD